MREECEQRELETLSPLATASAKSLGRLHPEQEHPLRTAFQRDRDRLIHSTAFRRLEYKTQVFVNHEGDYYRTRLTHTLEVVQIARSIARFLRLNEDLSEAMALAHDLGHTPFGHSAESVLDELMSSHGGFEHNAQGLRCVDLLETPYPAFEGLNLTYEVRSIFTKKSSFADLTRRGYASPQSTRFANGPGRILLEAQVVDLADSIAYNSHDIDDGLKSGLLTESALAPIPLWNEVASNAEGRDASIRRHDAVRRLINRQVTDVVRETMRRIANPDFTSAFDAQGGDHPALAALPRVVDFSPEMKQADTELKSFLKDRLYRHPSVLRQMERARRMILGLFETYTLHPEQMASQFRARLDHEPSARVVSDYIAGMTDRFAEEEYVSLHFPESIGKRSR